MERTTEEDSPIPKPLFTVPLPLTQQPVRQTFHENGSFHGHSASNTQASKSQIYKCTFCGFSASTDNLLLDHIVDNHARNQNASNTQVSKSQLYKCTYCEFSTRSEEFLSDHIADHHETNHTKSQPTTTQEVSPIVITPMESTVTALPMESTGTVPPMESTVTAPKANPVQLNYLGILQSAAFRNSVQLNYLGTLQSPTFTNSAGLQTVHLASHKVNFPQNSNKTSATETCINPQIKTETERPINEQGDDCRSKHSDNLVLDNKKGILGPNTSKAEQEIGTFASVLMLWQRSGWTGTW